MIRKVSQQMASRPSRIGIPAGALVVLIGAAASGKSTFAARQFDAACVVASDGLRAELTGPTPDDLVFAELHRRVQARLGAGLPAVVDATNTDWMWRAELVVDARRGGRPAVAIVFNLPLDVCLARNGARSRTVPAAVIRRQVDDVIRDIDRLDLEGFAAVHVLRSVAEVDAVRLEIEKGPVARALR
ncbi:MAG TPA: AAA family ATPase [Candidatus Dormibacteraeota bacterium]|nr:AAA family ATPase [Candidatus Dormibacteraeota bacterium]